MPKGIYTRTDWHKKIISASSKNRTPWNKGEKGVQICSIETRKKMSVVRKGKNTWSRGCKLSDEHKKKVSISLIGNKRCVGRTPWNWKTDRSLLAKKQERNDSAYRDWRMSVYRRDGFRCKISNERCEGRIVAHHILPWSQYPEERYNVNNGITLCLFHHPKRRIDEVRLSPFFRGLVVTEV